MEALPGADELDLEWRAVGSDQIPANYSDGLPCHG
jgi:hypothetical protein